MSASTNAQEGHSSPQELSVLQDSKGCEDGRSVHEPDPNLRVEWSQSFRLSHRVAAACCQPGARPAAWMPWNYRDTLAQLESAVAAHIMSPRMARKDPLRPCDSDFLKCL